MPSCVIQGDPPVVLIKFSFTQLKQTIIGGINAQTLQSF
jgi:hypothetical protein